jgi:hypothetical protein
MILLRFGCLFAWLFGCLFAPQNYMKNLRFPSACSEKNFFYSGNHLRKPHFNLIFLNETTSVAIDYDTQQNFITLLKTMKWPRKK